jgi:hypothetical protein
MLSAETATNWLRVSREMRCPICGKTDWCLVAGDKSAAICPRTESPKRCGDAGYLHVFASPLQRCESRRVLISTRIDPPNLTSLATEYQLAATTEHLTALAEQLRVSPESLSAYSVGWAARYHAWSFPMTDPATDKVTGIRLRPMIGDKFSVTGGKEALFLPASALPTDDTLLVLEGATDAIAARTIGFMNAVGRPSCSGGTVHLIALIKDRKPARVVIVRDNDEPGIRGAEALASRLALYSRGVRVIAPPDLVKDLRDWIVDGAARPDLEKLIDAANVLRVTITTSDGGNK